jgi:hypothetical protein
VGVVWCGVVRWAWCGGRGCLHLGSADSEASFN